ncbi:5'/3'-nucleotidase SurE [Promineifilum sp.]|uniref:5'/3'-nucleotidase SurE n=1 Tax=Promineifilum sp. TaxID=2664178 RepID=UPI0035B2E8EC
MHILVTNDDGVHAPGLSALVDAMKPLGDVTILAPDHNWSGGGHVKTLHRPLRVHETTLADGTPALSSDGAPSDCVALALLGRVTEKIDLVVSGINTFGNLGHDVTYSGTVTAAMEAVIAGVPGFAFSLAADDMTRERDYRAAAGYAGRIVRAAIAHGLTKDLLLNVNVPCLPAEQIKGLRVTRQGLRVYRDRLDARVDPRGQPYYWIGGDYPTGVPDEGTDFAALRDGYVSVTPLQLDLTCYELLRRMGEWEFGS